MIRVLICGSLTPLRASLSEDEIESLVHPICSVCKFGRDARHSTNNVEDSFHTRWKVMNLQRIRISPDPGSNSSAVVPYASSHEYIRLQSVHEGVELPRKESRIP